MLDIRLVREDFTGVEENLKRRGDEKYLDMLSQVSVQDNRWRELKKQADDLKHERNKISERIKKAKQSGEDSAKLIEDAKNLPGKISAIEDEAGKLESKIRANLMRLPNMFHESVPEGEGDEENVEVRVHGEPFKPDFELKHHGELAVELGIADFERAVKISGAGFYILKGELALIDLKLQSLALEMLVKKGYTIVEPPLMMRRKPYEGVTDLADFEDVMYAIDGEDEYLIATSEHPLAAMHMDEIFKSGGLPLKYAGVSPCFRREIGKHGIDERGLFRVHQFQKVEQFIYCRPQDSWNYHAELIANAEEYMKQLEIPYRVVNVCTGDMGTVAAKKYDLEGWSPREGKYIELVSCSNCTSYQANRLNIKYRDGQDKDYVHTLNSTMAATARLLRLILENYQTEDGGLRIPKALQDSVCCDYIG